MKLNNNYLFLLQKRNTIPTESVLRSGKGRFQSDEYETAGLFTSKAFLDEHMKRKDKTMLYGKMNFFIHKVINFIYMTFLLRNQYWF